VIGIYSASLASCHALTIFIILISFNFRIVQRNALYPGKDGGLCGSLRSGSGLFHVSFRFGSDLHPEIRPADVDILHQNCGVAGAGDAATFENVGPLGETQGLFDILLHEQ